MPAMQNCSLYFIDTFTLCYIGIFCYGSLEAFFFAYFCACVSPAFCTYPHPQSRNFLQSHWARASQLSSATSPSTLLYILRATKHAGKSQVLFCYHKTSLEICAYPLFSKSCSFFISGHVFLYMPQIQQPMFLLELRTQHFPLLLCYRARARALSLYYSLYLINEEQAPCLCLFITSLDVTFEDKETSLTIYNISYTLCTDSKLQQSRKDKKVLENLITYFKVGLRTYISEIEIKNECLIYLLSFLP